MPAYFICSNVNRLIANLVFEPIGSSSGVSYGVYQSEDDAKTAELRALASAGTNGVEEITETQYLERFKKKQARPLIAAPPSLQQPESMEETPGVVVADPKSQPPPEPTAEQSIDSIIQVEPVDVDEPAPVPFSRKKK